jgi:hypothetical protein
MEHTEVRQSTMQTTIVLGYLRIIVPYDSLPYIMELLIIINE